jgi:aspartyl protease family protein
MKIHALYLAAALAAAALSAANAQATDVTVIGLFPGKVVVTINRGAPRTLSVGEKTAEGVLLVSMSSKGAVFEVDGKRETLEMGQHFESSEQSAARTSVTLPADDRGHFVVDGAINGNYIRFMVDTGATLVAMSSSDAVRVGVDYRKGQPGISIMADGRRVASFRVMLDSVTVGDITLFNVEGSVTEQPGMGTVLLGNSFLNRMEMRREGQSLTLTKRY